MKRRDSNIMRHQNSPLNYAQDCLIPLKIT